METQDTERTRGRPRLTERRREQTRVEIAVEAARLFLERGVAKTSADDIAAAAGVARRTFWHYFSTKEEAVLPLLVQSLDRITAALERRPAEEPLLAALGQAMTDISEAPVDADVVGLVRLSGEQPGVRRVWLQATSDMETHMAAVISGRLGLAADDMSVRMQAAMITGAIRIMSEEYAWHGESYGENARTILEKALRLVADGFSSDSR